MAVFPPDAPNYTDPVFDGIMNYGSGTVLTPLFILSLLLNALVFYVNLTQRRMRTSTILFLALTVSDFLYTAVRIPYITYNLINPNISPGLVNAKPSQIQSVVASVGCVAAYSSICSIFGISIMRFIKLGYPIWAVSHKTATKALALGPTVITVLYSIVLELVVVFAVHDNKWSGTAQDVFLGYWKLLLIKMGTVLVPAALSFFFALATIAKLYQNEDLSMQTNRYSMVTILLLSVGNITWIGQWSVTATLGDNYFNNKTTGSIKPSAFVIFTFYVMMPSFIAFYNPLVLCIRTSRVRTVLMDMFNRIRGGRANRIVYERLRS